MNDTAATPPATGVSVADLCREVVLEWRGRHCPHASCEDQLSMTISRVSSWISPASVMAGTLDIFGTVRTARGGPLSQAAVEELGEKLGRRLRDSGLLLAQPRRSGLQPG